MHREVAFGQEFLHVAIAERKPQAQPDGTPDDLGRELMTVIRDGLRPLPYCATARPVSIDVTRPWDDRRLSQKALYGSCGGVSRRIEGPDIQSDPPPNRMASSHPVPLKRAVTALAFGSILTSGTSPTAIAPGRWCRIVAPQFLMLSAIWGWNKNCSQKHGNGVRRKNVTPRNEREASAMAECSWISVVSRHSGPNS
jgi:hypothetical protein